MLQMGLKDLKHPIANVQENSSLHVEPAGMVVAAHAEDCFALHVSPLIYIYKTPLGYNFSKIWTIYIYLFWELTSQMHL